MNHIGIVYENLTKEVKADGGYDRQYKVVSDIISNGYIVHGSGDEFDAFDTSMIKGGNRAEYGYGMYFSDSPYKPLEYGDNIMYTDPKLYEFMDLDEPCGVYKWISYSNEKLARSIYGCEDSLNNVRSNSEYERLMSELEELNALKRERETKGIASFCRTLDGFEDGDRMENVFKTALSKTNDEGYRTISELLLSLGFDGVKCGNQYCIFNFDKLNGNLKK